MLGKNYFSGVNATYKSKRAYEVFCNECGDSIGTFTFEQVRVAIFATLGRGGVLCPPCRKRTCDGCGKFFGNMHTQRPFAELKTAPGGVRGEVRACPACRKALLAEGWDDGVNPLVFNNP